MLRPHEWSLKSNLRISSIIVIVHKKDTFTKDLIIKIARIVSFCHLEEAFTLVFSLSHTFRCSFYSSANKQKCPSFSEPNQYVWEHLRSKHPPVGITEGWNTPVYTTVISVSRVLNSSLHKNFWTEQKSLFLWWHIKVITCGFPILL